MNIKEIKQFILKDNNFGILIEWVSSSYPLPIFLINKYKKIWNWAKISSNERINWSKRFIDENNELLKWTKWKLISPNNIIRGSGLSQILVYLGLLIY